MESTNQGPTSSAEAAKKRGFPDPSITLIEFGEGIGILLAARTDRDPTKRRIVLRKAAYIRLTPKGWGVTAFPEVWVEQNNDGLFLAADPQNKRIFHDPSGRRYEVAFISQEMFDCIIQCIKEQKPDAIYEFVAVTFATRPGFSVEREGFLAPEDYAAERHVITEDVWVPFPKTIEPADK